MAILRRTLANVFCSLKLRQMQRIKSLLFDSTREFDPVVVDGKQLEAVDTVDLLGVTFQLTWNSHIEKVIKKASGRLYFVIQLKRAKLLYLQTI